MSVQVRLTHGPLAARPASTPLDGVGAVLVFEGVVRPREGDGVIEALEYEAYEPMATTMIQRLAESLVAEHGLTAIEIEHSVGRVAVGEVSFRLTIQSPHRAEGLRGAAAFIDRLKQDVPIWKRPIWRERHAAADAPQT